MDVIAFDYFCHKNHINKKFIHFLRVSSIEFILVSALPNIKKQQVCDVLNKKERYREYTISRLVKARQDVMSELFRLERYAKTFGVYESIQPKTIEELHKIVEDYYSEREKENES